MDIDGLVLIKQDNLHQNVYEYIQTKSINVSNEEDIFDVYMSMIKDGYCFVIDRDIVLSCMIDILYVLSPTNENKELVKKMLIGEYDEDDNNSEEANDSDEGNDSD
tara:strand:+ start:231 stop:548 length:318 start_codon:yes stop_codon:yes gene_type:complete